MSNSPEVMEQFSEAEREPLAVILTDGPNASTLGVTWDTAKDEFCMVPTIPSRPFTKRGLLSVVNSLYDPCNFVSPVTLQGRLIQREVLSSNPLLDKYGWDDQLPSEYFEAWSKGV